MSITAISFAICKNKTKIQWSLQLFASQSSSRYNAGVLLCSIMIINWCSTRIRWIGFESYLLCYIKNHVLLQVNITRRMCFETSYLWEMRFWSRWFPPPSPRMTPWSHQYSCWSVGGVTCLIITLPPSPYLLPHQTSDKGHRWCLCGRGRETRG